MCLIRFTAYVKKQTKQTNEQTKINKKQTSPEDDPIPRNVGGSDGAGSSTEKRFAYNLLAKLLEYVDRAAYNIKAVKPGSR